jgi:hypothetical protein
VFAAGEFRLQECENVRDLLRNTLRYAYGSKSSQEVYNECLKRIQLIQDAFGILNDEDEDELQELSNQLSELSKLIGRVERSRIEEFSWPFALALQNLADKICAANKDPGSAKPLFFISADDELSSYQIETEQGRAGIIDSPLFSIVFPRSLKHFVLLHPILGHELGHAANSATQHAALLQREVLDPLIKKSPLSDIVQFEKWLKSTSSDMDLDQRTDAVWSWQEEFFCDLFGLLLMGPSYIGATISLLRPFKLNSISESHPPSATRFWMLEQAVRHLGWRQRYSGNKSLKKSVIAYFDSLTTLALNTPKKYRLLRESQITLALEGLQSFMRTIPEVNFLPPEPEQVARMCTRLLNGCPPAASDVSLSLKVTNVSLDFRSILFAGWLTWMSNERQKSDLSFTKLNMLCQRGILQQRAVDVWATYSERNRSGST